jgi:hypothetical protein
MSHERLTAALAAVCPIHGVGGSPPDVQIDYREDATREQREASQQVLAAFDWSDWPERISQIKARCRAEILARYPEWLQANMTARSVELLEQMLRGTMTAEDQADIDRIRAAWGWIKARREQSNQEEAELDKAPS